MHIYIYIYIHHIYSQVYIRGFNVERCVFFKKRLSDRIHKFHVQANFALFGPHEGPTIVDAHTHAETEGHTHTHITIYTYKHKNIH